MSESSRWVGMVLPLSVACTPAPKVADAEHVAAPVPAIAHAQTPLVTWPEPTSEVALEKMIEVSGTFDGGMRRFRGVGALATNDQDEHQSALFELADGAVLANVIVGDPAADGVHCRGSCTLRNVWWEDVGEDAATFAGHSPSETMSIEGGGARAAEDKVFQHNGPGTMFIKDFYVEAFGKLFRSCGKCRRQVGRHVVVENLTALADGHTAAIVGLNLNYGDTAEFRGHNVVYGAESTLPVCLLFEANDQGAEPHRLGPAPDGSNCKMLDANVRVERVANHP